MTAISNNLKPLVFLALFAINLSTLFVEGCHPDDERALLRIKAAFNNASIFSNFIPQTDCCNWEHIGCKVFSDSSVPRVSILIIQNSKEVVGEIPPAIAALTYIQLFIFSNLSLTGTIPNVFSRLKHIHAISLDNNNLTGSIPAYLGRITTLKSLDLQNNQLTGSIPDGFGPSWVSNFVLTLSNNHLTGLIPASLGHGQYLSIDISRNKLTGDASFVFGNNPATTVNLSHNRFSFNLSNVVPPADTSISPWDLFLDHNMIFGELPAWLGESRVLFSLDVSFNRLCGPIPTVGGRFQTFSASAFLHNKCLCGAPLPPCKS